jgi:hypothetical protein
MHHRGGIDKVGQRGYFPCWHAQVIDHGFANASGTAGYEIRAAQDTPRQMKDRPAHFRDRVTGQPADPGRPRA